MVKFEKVLDAAVKFFNEEIVPGMNDWQEIAARIAIGRVYESQEAIKAQLAANGVLVSPASRFPVPAQQSQI